MSVRFLLQPQGRMSSLTSEGADRVMQRMRVLAYMAANLGAGGPGTTLVQEGRDHHQNLNNGTGWLCQQLPTAAIPTGASAQPTNGHHQSRATIEWISPTKPSNSLRGKGTNYLVCVQGDAPTPCFDSKSLIFHCFIVLRTVASWPCNSLPTWRAGRPALAT